MTGPSPTGTASSHASPTRDREPAGGGSGVGNIAEAVLARDRVVVLGGLGAVGLLSWGYTLRLTAGSGQHGPGWGPAMALSLIHI